MDRELAISSPEEVARKCCDQANKTLDTVEDMNGRTRVEDGGVLERIGVGIERGPHPPRGGESGSASLSKPSHHEI